jgi:tRNA (guanine-N7-)-methyltransferase
VHLKSKTKNRLRHHTNPLTFRPERLQVPDWNARLGGAPQEVDIGIGMGDFLCAYAAAHPERRMVGLEVREAFCNEAKLRIEQAGLTNAAVVYVDATRFIDEVLPEQSIERAFISFPDPWFKKRHHKRRLVGSDFLVRLHRVLRKDAELLVQSDNQAVIEDIVAQLDASPLFANANGEGVQVEAPFTPFRTEREAYYERKGWPVWRYRYLPVPSA